MPPPEDQLDLPQGFWDAMISLQNTENQRDSMQILLNRAYDAFASGEPLSDKDLALFRQNFTALGVATGMAQEPTISDMTNQLRKEIDFINNDIETQTDTLFNLSPTIAAAFLPDKVSPERRERYGLQDPEGMGLVEVEIGGSTFRVSANSAAALAQSSYQFNNLSAGEQARLGQDMFFFNNLSAFQVESIQLALRTEDRLDERLAFDVETARATFEEGIRRFEIETALTERGLDLEFQGLQLEHRGQLITAIGQDFARQIEMGRMQFEEATLQLNRINVAFTQRRLEREQVLDFAVKQSSLRMRDGEQVTQLPFAGQFAKILGEATGQQFSAADFELAITTIDPNQTMLDVLGASDFTSPLPGLAAGLQQTREAIEGLFGAQAGSAAATAGEVDAATQGV